MNHQQQLEQVRRELDQIQQRIQELDVTEETWQQAQARKQLMDEQAEAANGRFSFQSEQELTLITKLRLDEELAALTAAIQTEHPPVEVVDAAREIQEPPQEVPVQKPGLFTRIGRAIKRFFTRRPAAPAPEPAAPAIVQAPRLSRRQRNAKLAQADKQAARWTQEGAAHKAHVNARMEAGQGVGLREIPEVREPVAYDDLMTRFLAAGWRNKKGFRPGEPLPEWTPEQQKTELQQFLRELSNAGLLVDAQPGDILQLNVSEYSKESILTLLSNNSSETVRTFLQPLLTFDSNAFLARFPLHKMTPQQRDARDQEIHEATHLYLGMIQWAEKFGEHVMTPELKREYLIATQKFNTISQWVSMRAAPTEYSFNQGYQMNLRHLDRLGDYMAHGEELTALGNQVHQELRAGEPAVETTAQALSELGIRSWEIRYIPRIQSMDGGRCQVFLPAGLLDRVNAGDLDTARGLLEQLNQFSLITEEGRPRLAGDEPVEELLQHGHEDMTAYARASEAAVLLKLFADKHRARLGELGYGTPAQVAALTVQIQQAKNAYFALADERLFRPGLLFTDQTNQRNNALDDPNWFLRRQNAELDAFERQHRR